MRNSILFWLVACAATGCAADPEEASPPGELAVPLPRSPSPEEVIDRVLAAAAIPLESFCGAHPDGHVEIALPLAPWFFDLGCAEARTRGGAAPLQRRGAFDSVGPRGTHSTAGNDDTAWSPLGLACGVIIGAAGVGGAYACDHASDPDACRHFAAIGAAGLGVLCAFV